MKHDNSSKQLLSPLDLPPEIPAGLQLDALDMSHAVASYRPGTHEPWDLPVTLPVFDKAGRLKRPRKGDRRVVSMPAMPPSFSSPPSPTKDLPLPPQLSPERPPVPQKDFNNSRAVSMYVLPKIMGRVTDPSDSPDANPNPFGLSPIASMSEAGSAVVGPPPAIHSDPVPMSPVKMAPIQAPRIMSGIRVAHDKTRDTMMANDLGSPIDTGHRSTTDPISLAPAVIAHPSPPKVTPGVSSVTSSPQHSQPPIVWKSPSRLDRSLLTPSPPMKDESSSPSIESPLYETHPYAVRSTDHVIAYPKIRKKETNLPAPPPKALSPVLASPQTVNAENSPRNTLGSADLDEIYRYYGNMTSPDFHIPKHLVIDDDDSLFSDGMSTDESSITSDSKSLSSAASSLTSHDVNHPETRKQSAPAESDSETSSILSRTFEEPKLEDFLDNEPELGVSPDDISLKDSLFSGLDSELESFREPTRTVSQPMLPYQSSYVSSVSINTNKELPRIPKGSDLLDKEQQKLQVRKCRNLKSYQRKQSDRNSLPVNQRVHSDRQTISSNRSIDSQRRHASDRHSIQFSSNQSQMSIGSRSTKLPDAKNELQAYVRQRPFSFCLDSGTDYSYSKYGPVSTAKKTNRPRSYSQSDRRSVSFTVASRNSLDFDPYTRQANYASSLASGQKKGFRSVSDFGAANRSVNSFKSTSLQARGFGSSNPYSQGLGASVRDSGGSKDSMPNAYMSPKYGSVSAFTPSLKAESFHTAPTSPTTSTQMHSDLNAVQLPPRPNLSPIKSPTKSPFEVTPPMKQTRNFSLPSPSIKSSTHKALPRTPERENRFGDRTRYIDAI